MSTAITSSFGTIDLKAYQAGQSVVLSVHSKRFVFANLTRVLNVGEDLVNVDFVANE